MASRCAIVAVPADLPAERPLCRAPLFGHLGRHPMHRYKTRKNNQDQDLPTFSKQLYRINQSEF
eukprot:4534472-Heterocapsa_arctica.AAC.1